MKKFFPCFALIGVLSLWGCSARYVDVGGEKYEMISESEEAELVEVARLTVSRIKSRLKSHERQFIMDKMPEIRFFYSGDRYGRAVMSWKLPGREVGVNYDGEFMTDHMSCRVYTRELGPDRIDYTKRLPARRTVRPRKGVGK